MADLRSKQLKDGFQTLVTIGATSTSDPTTGALTNGKNTAITQVTLGLGSASAPSYSFTGDTDTGMFSSGANALNLVTGNSTAIAIASGGNVAIGTSNISSAKLQVGTSSEEILRLERDTTTNDSFIDLTYAAGHSNDSDANHEYSKIRTKVVANLATQESSELHFQTINGGTMGTPVVIDNLGLVGIGSTSGGVPNPAYALEVQANSTSGVLAVQNAANDRNTFRSSNAAGTRTFDIGNNSSGHGIVNIRNSSGTVNTQLLGSGDSYFNGGNVAIGATSASQKLSVTGNIGTSGSVLFDDNQGVKYGNANAQITGSTANGLMFFAGGSEKMRFDTSGNLGIGATSVTSGFKTEVSGGFLRVGETQGEDAVEMGWFNSGNRGFIQVYDRGDSAYRDLLINDSLMIQSDGDVGIGTNSPSAKLQVEGDLDVRTASNKNLHIRSFPSFDNFSNQGVGLSMSRTSSDADLMAVGVVDTDKLGLFSRSGIILATGGSNAFQHTSEVVRIDGSGNVGIGTTSPAAKFEVTDGSSSITLQEFSNGAAIFLDGSNGDFTGGDYFHIIADGVGYLGLGGYGGGDTPLNVNYQGRVGVGTNSPSGLLHVKGDTNGNGAELFLQINNNNTTDTIGAIHFGNNADSTLSSISSFTSGNNTTSHLVFSVSDSGTQTGAMRILSSGNVGIGTTSPDSNLEIANNDGSSYRFGFGSSSDVYLDADNVYFRSDSGNTNYALLQSGKLGLGTLTPDEPIHVAKSSGDAIIAVEANDGNAALYLTSAGTNKDNRIVIGNAKDLKFEAQASGSNQGQGQDPTATATTVMTLTNAGNLALGANAPIEVSSTANWLTLDSDSGSSVSGGIVHAIDGTSKAVQYIFGSNVLYDAKSGIGHQFTVNNGSEVMRMDTASRMLVGKTSSGLGVEGVEFNTSSHFTNFTRERNSAGGTIGQFNRTGSADGSVITFYRSGSEVGSITVTSSATAFNTSSDYRLKVNIKP